MLSFQPNITVICRHFQWQIARHFTGKSDNFSKVCPSKHILRNFLSICLCLEFADWIYALFSNFSTYFHTIRTGLGVPKVIYDDVLSHKNVDTKLNSVDLHNWSQSAESDLFGQKNMFISSAVFIVFSFQCLGICKVW